MVFHPDLQLLNRRLALQNNGCNHNLTPLFTRNPGNRDVSDRIVFEQYVLYFTRGEVLAPPNDNVVGSTIEKQITFRIQEAAVLFVLAYIVFVFVWAKEGSFRSLAKQILTSGLVTLVVVGALGIVAVNGFHGAFDQFHVIVFDNDLWKLNPARDHLIQMFPEAFWQDVTILVGLVTLAEFGLLAALSAIYLGVTRGESVSFRLTRDAQPVR